LDGGGFGILDPSAGGELRATWRRGGRGSIARMGRLRLDHPERLEARKETSSTQGPVVVFSPGIDSQWMQWLLNPLP
jgi:hypothetical protein